MSSVLLGSSNPEQLIENLGAIQASARGSSCLTPALLQGTMRLGPRFLKGFSTLCLVSGLLQC